MAATDTYGRINPSNMPAMNWPASNAFAITPHDTNELTYVTRGIWIGGAGNVKVTTVNGDTVTFTGALAGTIIPVRAKIVFSTGTTATSMIGIY